MPPFSGKKKKKQLQEKRQRKKQQGEYCADLSQNIKTNNSDGNTDKQREEEYKYGADKKGIRSIFYKETREEVAARKKLSYEPLEKRQFIGDSGIPFGSWFNMPGHKAEALIPLSAEVPLRGWTCNDAASLDSDNCDDFSSNCGDDSSKNSNNNDNNSCGCGVLADGDDVENYEEMRFKAYLDVLDNYPLPQALREIRVNTYERNIDVWRQFWRAVDQSDLVVIVADVRYTLLHLPLSLLHYIVRQCKKLCIVVINKADLVPKSILDKWLKFLPLYFKATGIVAATEAEAMSSGVVSEIPLLPFTSLPAVETAFGAEEIGNVTRRRKKNKRRVKLYEQLRAGKLQLSEMFSSTVSVDDDDDDDDNSDDNNNAAEWKKEDAYAETDNFKGMKKAEVELQCDSRQYKELHIVSEMISTLLQKCREMCASKRNIEAHDRSVNNVSDKKEEGERPMHIGFVGHPNVGKSSLLNCIRGTKVVSVSSTPGHTKHLQTISIPSEHLVLIDSPGLVFPVFGMPQALQAVIGTHQIAQTRDPQSGVAFLASHMPLERIYGLRKVDGADDTVEWSSYELCESYAKKRGFFVKHGKGAPDIHRGSIEILKEACEGRLVLFFAPPDVEWLESDEFREKVAPYLLLPVQLPDTAGEV